MFAEKFPRDKHGWIEFPPDAKLRKELFPYEELRAHPAKNNLYEYQAIISYLYKPDELLLDPMSGSGSIMIATLMECKVICIETSPMFAAMLEIAKDNFDADITVLQGDCMEYLPLPVDHILFSPPFADTLKKSTLDSVDSFVLKMSSGRTVESHLDWTDGKNNLGMLPDFFHFQMMEKVFKLCKDSIKDTGTVTIITRDSTEQGKRMQLTRRYCKSAERVGLDVAESFKRLVPRTGMDHYNAEKGVLQIDDEDICVLRKHIH